MKYENLEVWKRAAALSSTLYLYFRECKDFGFRDQITRSGLSIPSNIAEGIEREKGKQWIDEVTQLNRMIGGLKKSLTANTGT